RVEPGRLLQVPERCLPSAEALLVEGQRPEQLGVAGCEGERGAVLSKCTGIVCEDVAVVVAKGLVTLGSGGRKRPRPLGRAASRLAPGWGGLAAGEQDGLRAGESRPGLDKGRIERHRLLVRDNRLAETRW